MSVCGTGAIFIEREPRDIFINNFNPNLMMILEANHNIQIVVDPYACAQHIYAAI